MVVFLLVPPFFNRVVFLITIIADYGKGYSSSLKHLK